MLILIFCLFAFAFKQKYCKNKLFCLDNMNTQGLETESFGILNFKYIFHLNKQNENGNLIF